MILLGSDGARQCPSSDWYARTTQLATGTGAVVLVERTWEGNLAAFAFKPRSMAAHRAR